MKERCSVSSYELSHYMYWQDGFLFKNSSYKCAFKLHFVVIIFNGYPDDLVSEFPIYFCQCEGFCVLLAL